MGFKTAHRRGGRQGSAAATSEQIAALGRQITKLERKLQRVEDHGHELWLQMHMLTTCTIRDPRYPYWNWLLTMSRTDDQRRNLEIALGRLTHRITGATFPIDTRRNVKGVPREVLFRSGPPTVEEIFTAIKGTLELKLDRHCVEVIRALDAQGLEQTLCEYVLARIDQD